jgi:hypothetical protein
LHALEDALTRHRAALVSTGHDEADVENDAGPGITKRMHALRRAGNAEADAAAAVAAAAAAVVADAAAAAATTSSAEFAAAVETRMLQQVTRRLHPYC